MSVARLVLAGLCAVAVAQGSPVDTESTASTPPRKPIEPSYESARDNAYLIFNAVHSAGRQWGSSLNHNGFGFFPAVMPKGTVLYHGTRSTEPPPAFEWLAFEIEHSEQFAQSIKWDPSRPLPLPPSPPKKDSNAAAREVETQKPLSHAEERLDENESDDDGDEEETYFRGYLHTYRANRDLHLLYVDGMGAGKTDMGTLDTQDYVLRGTNTSNSFSEWERANDICGMITEWGYDGLVRMEIGFEVIHCDFNTGVDLLSVLRSSVPDDRLMDANLGLFHWARAVGERYDGLGADRLRIDFSSMVSGLFFPINISSTDPKRPDLLRLGGAALDDLQDIREHLHGVSTQPRRFTVNWQGVADMAVARYADRLLMMSTSDATDEELVVELERATLTYFDAPPRRGDKNIDEMAETNRTTDALQRCREAYFLPVLGKKDEWSLEDDLIYTALDTVLHELCSTLYTMRGLLLEAAPDKRIGGYRINQSDDGEQYKQALTTSRELITELVKKLAWTEWKKTRPCPADEVMFVAMWPFGDKEDHWNPGCRSIDDLHGFRGEYWNWVARPSPGNRTRPKTELDAMGGL